MFKAVSFSSYIKLSILRSTITFHLTIYITTYSLYGNNRLNNVLSIEVFFCLTIPLSYSWVISSTTRYAPLRYALIIPFHRLWFQFNYRPCIILILIVTICYYYVVIIFLILYYYDCIYNMISCILFIQLFRLIMS